MSTEFTGHHITDSCKGLLERIVKRHGLINCYIFVQQDGRYNFTLSWTEAGDPRKMHLVSNRIYHHEQDDTFLDVNEKMFVICDFNSQEPISRKDAKVVNSTLLH